MNMNYYEIIRKALLPNSYKQKDMIIDYILASYKHKIMYEDIEIKFYENNFRGNGIEIIRLTPDSHFKHYEILRISKDDNDIRYYDDHSKHKDFVNVLNKVERLQKIENYLNK